MKENSGKSLSNYPVPIVLNSTNWDLWSFVNNPNTIYFTDSAGKPLYYWIERFDTQNKIAWIWVNITTIPANSQITIYMYSCSSNPYTGYNNPKKVFIYFDDFSTNTLSSYVQINPGWYIDTTRGYLMRDSTSTQGFIYKPITLNRSVSGYAVRARLYYNYNPSYYNDIGVGFFWGTAGRSESSVYGYIANYYPTTQYSDLRRYQAGRWATLQRLPTLSQSGWYVIEFAVTSTSLFVYRSNINALELFEGFTTDVNDLRDTTYTTLSGVGFRQKQVSSIAVDWWYLRPFTYPEPTVSIGSSTAYFPLRYIEIRSNVYGYRFNSWLDLDTSLTNCSNVGFSTKVWIYNRTSSSTSISIVNGVPQTLSTSTLVFYVDQQLVGYIYFNVTMQISIKSCVVTVYQRYSFSSGSIAWNTVRIYFIRG